MRNEVRGVLEELRDAPGAHLVVNKELLVGAPLTDSSPHTTHGGAGTEDVPTPLAIAEKHINDVQSFRRKTIASVVITTAQWR